VQPCDQCVPERLTFVIADPDVYEFRLAAGELRRVIISN
jgi:hypothetical protein